MFGEYSQLYEIARNLSVIIWLFPFWRQRKNNFNIYFLSHAIADISAFLL